MQKNSRPCDVRRRTFRTNIEGDRAGIVVRILHHVFQVHDATLHDRHIVEGLVILQESCVLLNLWGQPRSKSPIS